MEGGGSKTNEQIISPLRGDFLATAINIHSRLQAGTTSDVLFN